MKRFVIILICICMLLAACGKKSEQTDPTDTTVATTVTDTPSTTAPEYTDPVDETYGANSDAETRSPLDETTAPEEDVPLLYQHPLTGEMLSEPVLSRPVAISTNNYSPAQPVLGIAKADIIFEHVTEGGGLQTRMLALYTNLDFNDQLGTIRSARTYSLELAKSFNAPFVHCGGSYLVDSVIAKTKYPSFNQFYYAQYFYRDADRLAAGYSSDHTLVTEGRKVLQGLQENNFDLSAEENAYYGFTFSDTPTAGELSANQITAQFYRSEGKRTIMTYNKEDGMYYGLQKWSGKQAEILDGNTMDLVPFKNIVILKVKTTLADNGVHSLMDLTSGGEGYFACNGTYSPITWGRDENGLFTYTLEDGTPVTFGVGKTYVIILPTRSPDVIFE